MNLLSTLLLSTGGIVAIAVVAALLVIAIAIVCWYISTHNKFVRMRSMYEDSFSGIDVYLKKRYDLVPNLVETVKGYAKHESETFIKVTEARSKVAEASTPAEKIEADKQFSQAIRNFNMVLENYPELKANVNFMDLQNQLKSIESELVNARKYYNATVREFNAKRETFPASIVAKRMRLEKQPYFTVDAPEERQNVKVQF